MSTYLARSRFPSTATDSPPISTTPPKSSGSGRVASPASTCRNSAVPSPALQFALSALAASASLPSVSTTRTSSALSRARPAKKSPSVRFLTCLAQSSPTGFTQFLSLSKAPLEAIGPKLSASSLRISRAARHRAMTAVTSSLDLSELHLQTVKPVTRALYVAAIAAFLALGLVTRSSAARDYDTALVQELHRMWKAGFGVQGQ